MLHQESTNSPLPPSTSETQRIYDACGFVISCEYDAFPPACEVMPN